MLIGDPVYPRPENTIARSAQVVNALSEWVRVEVIREGGRHNMSFTRGKADGPLQTEEAEPRAQGGTTVRFKPDAEVTESSRIFVHLHLTCKSEP